VEYINENNVPDITVDDIIWCGIMDWGRLPYGAGNHAWRPERRFWEAMADLAEISFEGAADGPYIHVCGEAFADYTGFIEGSLRSATYTLTKILRKDIKIVKKGEKDCTAAVLKNILGVLGADSDPDSRPKGRERDYLQDLKSWVDSLDAC
jgi:hypothetical protein